MPKITQHIKGADLLSVHRVLMINYLCLFVFQIIFRRMQDLSSSVSTYLSESQCV